MPFNQRVFMQVNQTFPAEVFPNNSEALLISRGLCKKYLSSVFLSVGVVETSTIGFFLLAHQFYIRMRI